MTGTGGEPAGGMAQAPPAELAAWSPAAVVFDCDGLLVDTEPCWTAAETELFARRGLPFGDTEKALLIGKSVASACLALEGVFGEPGAGSDIAEELLLLVERAVAAGSRPMAGAVSLVTEVARRVPVAVASNSPRSLLDLALRGSGLAALLPRTVAADEVAAPKPAPDLYAAACGLLGRDPADCLAFEDSATGVRSAKAAGLPVVGIPTLPHTDIGADAAFAALDDPALLAWVARW